MVNYGLSISTRKVMRIRNLAQEFCIEQNTCTIIFVKVQIGFLLRIERKFSIFPPYSSMKLKQNSTDRQNCFRFYLCSPIVYQFVPKTFQNIKFVKLVYEKITKLTVQSSVHQGEEQKVIEHFPNAVIQNSVAYEACSREKLRSSASKFNGDFKSAFNQKKNISGF